MLKQIAGIIGWIGTALVFGAVAVRMFYPEWNQYATYAAWAGLVSVLIYMAGQWRDVAEFYKGRGAKYGTMSIVSIVVFLGILVAVNYLGTRQNKRWDLTGNQVYSLSDQTIRILKELKEPVHVTVFEQKDRQDPHKDAWTIPIPDHQADDRVHRPGREPPAPRRRRVETLPTSCSTIRAARNASARRTNRP